MKINLNGSPAETQSLTLMELVREQGLDPACLITEYNFAVVTQDAWPQTPIKNGDTIELLSFVGGG